jgi:excisionase family DNA binding protein
MKNTVLNANLENIGQPPRLAFTMKETAAMLGVSYITVHRLLKRGLLRSSLALRHKLIPLTEIQRFLRESVSVS